MYAYARSTGWIGAGLLLSLPGAAMAELSFKPYTGAQYQHYSNIFEVSGKQEARAQNDGDDTRADESVTWLAGLDTEFGFGQQKLRAEGEYRRVEFDRFADLDHNEHRYVGGLDWKLGSAFDGLLEYGEERRVASFADLDTSELTLRKDRFATGRFNVNVTPVWRLETAASRREYELPLPESPQFTLREDIGVVGIKYLGVSKVQAGIEAEFVDGDFSGVEQARAFEEQSLRFVVDYEIGGFTRLNLQLGAAQREEDVDPVAGEDDDGKVTGFTGAIGYHRELSTKTSVYLQAFRQFDTYTAGAESLINTGAGGGLTWAPTGKLRFTTSYFWGEVDFQDDRPSLDPEISSNRGRRDEVNTVNGEIVYQALTWLSLRPYGEYRHRDSSLEDAGFKASVVGVELLAGFR